MSMSDYYNFKLIVFSQLLKTAGKYKLVNGR